MHHIGPIAGITPHGPWIAGAGYDNHLPWLDPAAPRACRDQPVPPRRAERAMA